MNVTQYNQKRDELSKLLEDVIKSLDDVQTQYTKLDLSTLNQTKEHIKSIRKQVYEDFYKIVLVSRFQGGKSTSFNAITGGVCIAPMGNGSIKCSASPVFAKNVVNANETGVTVHMRSLQDLSAILSSSGFHNVDLTSAESVEITQSAWKAKFELWKETPATVFSEDGERDMFFVAGFILEFFNHPVVQEHLEKKVIDVSLESLGKYAKFPERYLIDFSARGPWAFKAEEALYAFVKKVEARVQNNEMAKIGASFVDAPGLHANAYDTCVTQAELSDASAVWYLLDAKQPGEKDLEAIKDCWSLCKGLVFFSANIKDNKLAKPLWLERVLPTIKATVNQAIGNTVDNTQEEVRPYHALMALLYIQGSYFVEHGKWVDDSVRDFLVKSCEEMGVPSPSSMTTEECWCIMASYTISGLYPFGLPDFKKLENPLSPEGLAILRRESNWDGTVEAIREFVVNSKSEIILISNTSEKALGLIHALKLLLKQRESDAQKSFEESFAEYTKAEEKLKNFINFRDQHIRKKFEGKAGKTQDALISQNLYSEVYENAVDEIARKAAPLISDKSGLFRIAAAQLGQWVHSAGRFIANFFRDEPNTDKVENSFKVEIAAIMRNTMQEVISRRTTQWIQQIQIGGNDSFKAVLLEPAYSVFEHLKNEWNEECATDEILKGIAPISPELPEPFIQGRFDSPDIMGYLTTMNFSEFVKALVVACLGGIIGSSGAAYLFIPDPVYIVVALIGVVLYKIVCTKLKTKDQMVEEIRNKLAPEIRNAFSNPDHKSGMVKNMATAVSVYREAVIKILKKPFDDILSRFEQAKAAAEKIYNYDSEQRAQVYKESREIREKYIEGPTGLEQRLSDYIKETKPLCIENSLNDK